MTLTNDELTRLRHHTRFRGGCTCLREGRTGRFIVGDGRQGFQVDAGTFFSIVENRGVESLIAALPTDGFDGVGTWVDGRTVFLDPVTAHDDLHTAWTLAQERGEQAFFDTVREEVIPV